MNTSFYNRRFLGIRVGELIIFFLFYFAFATFYYVTLWINRGSWEGRGPLIDVVDFFDSVGLDYMLKALLTYPLWWLLFRKLRHWSLERRLLLHLIGLPAFVLIWQQLYYVTCDLIGFGHLGGFARVWDIYIPALFYVLQFGIFHAYNYHLEHQKKLKLEGELRTAALKSELSALKAQLNPHFLYNIFNTISASVPAENEHTRQLIAELSDLFRYQLKASQVEKVTLREELAFVKKYLDLEKERFKERLEINIDVDQEILDDHIPPMLLQPLVENSIKHGLSSLIEGGKISIIIKKENGRLKFVISDTGVGISDKASLYNKGIGLTNTRLRLEKLYKTTLNISDNDPRGLKVSFTL